MILSQLRTRYIQQWTHKSIQFTSFFFLYTLLINIFIKRKTLTKLTSQPFYITAHIWQDDIIWKRGISYILRWLRTFLRIMFHFKSTSGKAVLGKPSQISEHDPFLQEAYGGIPKSSFQFLQKIYIINKNLHKLRTRYQHWNNTWMTT